MSEGSQTQRRCFDTRAVAICADLDRVEVRDDEQRRIAQRLAVFEELDVCGFQILALALVLPAEEVPLPDVGEAAAADGLLEGLLEGIRGTGRVCLGRSRLAEHRAQVEEVGLGGRTFGRLDAAPPGGELAGCHANDRSASLMV